MHYSPHDNSLHLALAHIVPASSTASAEAGPSYMRPSPPMMAAPATHHQYHFAPQPQQQQQYHHQPQISQMSNYAPAAEPDYFDTYDGAYTCGTSPSGSSIGTPVNDSVLSYPQIADQDTEPYPTSSYPMNDVWQYDAPQASQAHIQPVQQPVMSKSSLHGALGDEYNYDNSAPPPSATFHAGIAHHDHSHHPHPGAGSYGAAVQAPVTYIHHQQPPPPPPSAPEMFTEQRTVTVSYTVNVTTTRTPHVQQRPAFTQAVYAHPRPVQASAYGAQRGGLPMQQMQVPAGHHQRSSLHQHQHQPIYPTYLPAQVPQQHQHAHAHAYPQSHPHSSQQMFHFGQSLASYPPVHLVQRQRQQQQQHEQLHHQQDQHVQTPAEMELYQPKPVHPLPKWTHRSEDFTIVPANEHHESANQDPPLQWDNSPVPQAHVTEVSSNEDDEDEDEDEEMYDSNDNEDDVEGEEEEEVVEADDASPTSGSLPEGSLLCQPVSDSVRAQFAGFAPAQSAMQVPVAAQGGYWG